MNNKNSDNSLITVKIKINQGEYGKTIVKLLKSSKDIVVVEEHENELVVKIKNSSESLEENFPEIKLINIPQNRRSRIKIFRSIRNNIQHCSRLNFGNIVSISGFMINK